MLSSKRFWWEACVEFACDVTLEATDGFGFGFAFGAAALEVCACRRVVGEAGDNDPPEGTVGLTIATTTEAMSLLFAAGCVEWCGATQPREGSFVVDPARVLAGGDQ